MNVETKAKKIEDAFRKAVEKDAETRTQDQLALDAGVSAPSIHQYRKKGRNLKWTTVVRILAAMGFEIARTKAKIETAAAKS